MKEASWPQPDPYLDLIHANVEATKDIYEKGLRLALEALEKGSPEIAKLIIKIALCFHPMHGESWPGWPAKPKNEANP
jgi:hypothetical protein